ncbi:MAG: tripartite tricarboxylate transporter substrate binding protein [Burkholderiales bacterium]|nr:tripartite tricarboxylate transporter substrate binding protein [Burkholderiales bacterium]
MHLWRAAAIVVAGVLAAGAAAQDFPVKPVRIVVPFAPGGNVDITARTIAGPLGELLGQQVVVENRPGGGGMVATAQVVKGPADGYALVLGSSSTISVAPATAKNPPYDPTRDLAVVGPIQAVPIVLTASAKTTITSYREFVAQAQARPGRLSVASAGTGTSNHLAIELLMRQTGLKLIHVPYKGSGPALIDLVGGQVETMMDQLTASANHIKEGRLRALAVTTARRSALLPEVPTLAELGVGGYEVSTFTGLFAPAGTPRAVLDRLGGALARVLAQGPVRERFAGLGVEMIEGDARAFEAYVRRDFENWRAVSRDAGIALE